MPTFAIRPIPFEATYPLRHQVLWPTKPVAYCHLPEDAEGQHFGAFRATTPGGAEELVAVISLFVDGKVARFRKFATRPDCQSQGLGTALLRHTLAVAQQLGAHTIGCDARQTAGAFYARFGLAPTGAPFYKGPIAYVRMVGPLSEKAN